MKAVSHGFGKLGIMNRSYLIRKRPMSDKNRSDIFHLYDLKIEVHSDGLRPMICNHPVGSYFLLSGENITFPDGGSFPIYCLAALIPILPAKQRLTHANDWMTTDLDVACPD